MAPLQLAREMQDLLDNAKIVDGSCVAVPIKTVHAWIVQLNELRKSDVDQHPN